MKFLIGAALILLASGCMPAMNATYPDEPSSNAPSNAPVKNLAWYEENKLDKADALALSLFCPGSGFFYAREPTTGIVSLAVNFSVAYGFFNAIDKRNAEEARTFGLLMAIARAADVGLSLKAVGDYNRGLRMEAGLAANQLDGRPQPTITLSLNF